MRVSISRRDRGSFSRGVNTISMHGNIIFMHSIVIFMHERGIVMDEIFLSRYFHA